MKSARIGFQQGVKRGAIPSFTVIFRHIPSFAVIGCHSTTTPRGGGVSLLRHEKLFTLKMFELWHLNFGK